MPYKDLVKRRLASLASAKRCRLARIKRGVCGSCGHRRDSKNVTCSRCIRQINDSVRRKKTGWGAQAYTSALANQQGVCAICLQAETVIGRGGAVKALAADHDHITGRARGLLCWRCNTLVGLAKDNPSLLVEAANYLVNYQV